MKIDVDTFPDLLRTIASRYGERTAISLSGPGMVTECLSFAGLERASAELARALLAVGAGKGTRIGIVAGNGPFFAIAFAGVARIGAIAIPISTTIRADELVRVLRQSDVSGLIVQHRFLGIDYVQRLADALPTLRDADADPSALRLARAPYLRWIAAAGDDLPTSITGMPTLLARSASVDEALLVEVEAEVHPSDQMLEIYTSGSMAQPKGVKHSHAAVMSRARFLADKLGVAAGQQLPAALPMFWVGGLMMALLPGLFAGATITCTERTLRNSRMATGSVLSDEDVAAMAGARVIWGLGMTETLGPYSYGDELRAAGYPLCAPMDHFADGFEVRVADEGDRAVPAGQTGEIQVRGPAVTMGLHKLPRSTYLTADGYLRTGDMGFFEGPRLLFTGRRGDMIKTAGSNVSPAEVELELQSLPGIRSAYVLGLPDRERGQIVVAAVIADDPPPDLAQVEAQLRQRLSSYKVPRLFVPITRDEVPMLPSNKVARRELAVLLAERLGRPAGW